ncbi:MAG: magnesium transporter CorA [Pseudomonadota bacterium]|nr:magnesium transporter CorA [Pseudomonadota bacterium]
MLIVHDFANASFEPWPGSGHIPEGATWIDANAPTAEETAFIERALGVTPPNLAKMSEIESSSRLYRLRDSVCVTLPLPRREPDGAVAMHPLALIVTPKALLTVRYEALKPCEPQHLEAMGLDRTHPSAVGATLALLETIVDHLADELELVTARLDKCSRQIFAAPDKSARGMRSNLLKSLIPEIGRQREFNSLVDESLLTLTRAVPFLATELSARLTPETTARLDRIGRDVQSLSSHENRLSEKIQFLLDASLGLIGVEQNDIFKVLTIVSVIGIPPTLIASMYGMNFKTIPEYDWSWGYQYGLTLIVASALIPLAWFKYRRWW